MKLAPFILIHALASTLHGADIHVSPSGKDSNDGSAGSPFATLVAARDAARKSAKSEAVTIHVADGTYYLPETLILTPDDSGSMEKPVVYKAVNEGKAIISGGLKLALEWKPFRNGIYQAETPAGTFIDQLFVNGTRQRMARYPDYDPDKTTDAYQGYAADAFSKERAARWRNPTGGYIHAMHASRWGGYHYHITGKDAEGNVTYEGGWQNNRRMGMHKDQRMVENIFEELDAPGEWFHDANKHTLYYMPETGADPAKSIVEIVRLPHLIELRGSMDQPVRDITLSGFVFRHTARTFMENKEPLLRSDWTIYRGGTIKLTGTERVSIIDSVFDQPGGNAVFFDRYNRKGLVKGCHIHDCGASGVCFVGDPDAVRDPLFEYSQRNDLETIDRTPGPKSDNYPADCAVEDSLIHGIGRVERQPAGIQISMSARIAVRDCSIYDCARSGINFSEGTWSGHLIEGCDVFDTVLETHDHGSFNSWGRDRFWHPDPSVTNAAVLKNPDLPFLDARETNVIRNSRWRCDHGWDIDLDDGSSNYEIYNNLLLHGGLKFREGFGRKAWNNILINNGFHPHVWYQKARSSFRHNIVMAAHRGISNSPDWIEQVDQNFFTSEPVLRKNQSTGCDAHSLAGDPMFLDPANGDFRVADASPALKAGFRNFPMDRFGVKKPSLKAIAKTPGIPSLVKSDQGQPAENAGNQPTAFWMGSRLHALEGDEFSAFGVARDTGGVQLAEVPAKSSADLAGLKANDLVIRLNDQQTPDLPAFFAALFKAGGKELRLEIIREQKAANITIRPTVSHRIETTDNAEKLKQLPLPAPARAIISTNIPTNNEPLANLTDGMLAQNYGPVFSNQVNGGIYQMDLGASRNVTAIRTWTSYGARAAQRITLYGSKHPTHPGWNIADRERFTPLGSIDTRSVPLAPFVATELSGSFGKFRWILWHTGTLNPIGENSAFQEIQVITSP